MRANHCNGMGEYFFQFISSQDGKYHENGKLECFVKHLSLCVLLYLCEQFKCISEA